MPRAPLAGTAAGQTAERWDSADEFRRQARPQCTLNRPSEWVQGGR